MAILKALGLLHGFLTRIKDEQGVEAEYIAQTSFRGEDVLMARLAPGLKVYAPFHCRYLLLRECRGRVYRTERFYPGDPLPDWMGGEA